MAYPKMGEITDKFVGQPYDLNSVLSPAKVWEKLDAQSEEVRVFVNGLIDLLNSTGEDNWLYTAIVNAILGQITDGSLTDVKLSDAAGQIKDKVTLNITDYAAFKASKAQIDGLASLNGLGKLVASQLDLSVKVGTISNGAAIPQTAGYANYIYFVSVKDVSFQDTSTGAIKHIVCSVDQSTRIVTCSLDSPGTANYLEIAW